MRMTGLLGRDKMDDWSIKIKIKLKDNIVKMFLMSKYIDDCNLNTESVGLGSRWVDEEDMIRWKEESEEEDIKQKNSHSRVIMNCQVDMTNSISDSLTFTGDIPEHHKNNKLLMLDFCM